MVLKAGARVVRGRDWKWGNQDGGEGGVGTIISIDASSKLATVLWDNGNQAEYRAGHKGCFDLRTLDSAPAGVKYTTFSCDGCMAGIAGMRWHCSENQCKNYNLCFTCYFNDVHGKDHTFTCFDDPNDSASIGVQVGKRTNAKAKITAKGLFPGATVRIGKDWMDGKVNVDKHTLGIVRGVSPWLDTPRSGVIVEWGTSNIQSCHRTGFQGKVDLMCIDYGEGYLYYKEHLPDVSVDNVGRGRLREGDMVTIHLEVDILMAMEKGHGGWIPAMKETIGKVGTVVRTNPKGNIAVKYEGLKHATYTFHPVALYKIPELKERNKVRLLNDKEIVKKLQNSLWKDGMAEALGCKGEVIHLTDKGSAVVAIDGNFWEFNPAVLILEHAHHENLEDMTKERVSNMLPAQSRSLDDIGDELVSAAFEGDTPKVKRFIELDRTKVNHQLSDGKCALHMACLNGQVDLTHYLLNNGADKDIKDNDKCTPLHHAAKGQDYEALCTHTLLEIRANINACNAADETPLNLAVQNGNEAVVGALVQSQNCDINYQDKRGNTPLHIAILQSKDSIFLEIIGSCEKSAIDPTLCNKEGLNLLHLACSKNNTKAVKELVSKYPLLLSIQNPEGWYPLHLAVLSNQYQNTQSILDLDDCDIDLKNKEKNQTALFLAVSQGHRSIIELLVKKRANVNAEDAFGNTPLHVAVRKHCMFQGALPSRKDFIKDPQNPNVKHLDYAIAIFLVLHGGADINYLNHEGKTPLDFCTDKELARHLNFTSEKCTANLRRSDVMEFPDESNLKRAAQSSTGGSAPSLTNTIFQTEQCGGTSPCQPGPSMRSQDKTFHKFSVEAQEDSPEHYEPTIRYRHCVSWPSLPTLPWDSCAPQALSPRIDSLLLGFSPSVPGNAFSGESAITEAFAHCSVSGNASPQPITTSGALFSPPPAMSTTSAAILSTPTTGDLLSSPLPLSLGSSLHPPLIPSITSPCRSPQLQRSSGDSIPRRPSPVLSKSFETLAAASPCSMQSKTEEQTRCLCEDNIAEVIFEPCQHKVVCKECAVKMKRCSKCEAKIEYKRTTDGSPVNMTSPTSLRPENENIEVKELKKQVEEGEIKTKCPICMENEKNVVFGCGHTSCERCSSNQEICYFCTKKIEQKSSLFL